MKRVLGIDPGSRVTGYGVVEGGDGETRYVASGTIRLNASRPMHERLDTLWGELTEVLSSSAPAEVAVERVFVSRNADSALKLGHARGVILLAIKQAGLPLFEYTPAQVKKTVTGRGRADKHQMVSLVRLILGIEADLAEDAADALAIAMTHVMLSGERDMLSEYLD
ncbi:MAG: crossover junction endodeoxyribonuclease RuvC [Deltaproteobacteria bacterium]|nr:crossover junction endodeoxyribonuclease RuvC [Deltaproteobacteria bacterium]